MTKKPISFKKIAFYIVCFLVVFCSHDTMLFGTNSDELFILARKIIPFVILLLSLFIIKPSFSLDYLIKLLVLVSLPILSCLVNHEEINNYIYRACLMTDAFLLAIIKDDELVFTHVFNSIISFLCVWSLVFWALSSIVPSFADFFPKIINTEGNAYPNFIFSTVDRDSRYIFTYRNSGAFREPGVFACVLSIALLFELCRRDLSLKRFWIYIVTLISTFSTAGIILGVIFVVYLAFFEKRSGRIPKFISRTVVVGTLIVLALVGTGNISSTGIFDKFKQGTNSYGSWFSRLESVFGNLKIFASSPVFGVGRYHLYGMTLAASGNYVAIDNTNTYLINFAAFGFVYALLCIIGTVRFFAVKTNHPLRIALFTMLLFVALSNEDFGQNIAYLYIVMFGLFRYERKRETVISSQDHQLAGGL